MLLPLHTVSPFRILTELEHDRPLAGRELIARACIDLIRGGRFHHPSVVASLYVTKHDLKSPRHVHTIRLDGFPPPPLKHPFTPGTASSSTAACAAPTAPDGMAATAASGGGWGLAAVYSAFSPVHTHGRGAGGQQPAHAYAAQEEQQQQQQQPHPPLLMLGEEAMAVAVAPVFAPATAMASGVISPGFLGTWKAGMNASAPRIKRRPF